MTVGIGRLVPATIAIGLALLAPAGVEGHAELMSSVPQAGAILDEPPTEVELIFDDELDPDRSELRVTDAASTRVGSGGVDLEVADRNVLRAPLDADAAGRYEVAWTAVAADAHAESGTFAFTVSNGDRLTPDTATTTSRTTTLTGFVLLIGAVALTLRGLVRRPNR